MRKNMYKKQKKRIKEILNEFVDLFPDNGEVTTFIQVLQTLNYCSRLQLNKPLNRVIKLTRTEIEYMKHGL